MIGTVKISIEDAKRRKSGVTFYVDTAAYVNLFNGVLEDIAEYFHEVARRLDLLIRGRITGITMTVDLGLPVGATETPAIKTTAQLDADVEEIAVFIYPKAGASVYFQHAIPTFDHAFFGAAKTVSIDDDADLSAYVYLVILPTDAPNWAAEYGGIVDARGESVTSVPKVTKEFRSSRGGG